MFNIKIWKAVIYEKHSQNTNSSLFVCVCVCKYTLGVRVNQHKGEQTVQLAGKNRRGHDSILNSCDIKLIISLIKAFFSMFFKKRQVEWPASQLLPFPSPSLRTHCVSFPSTFPCSRNAKKMNTFSTCLRFAGAYTVTDGKIQYVRICWGVF